ncbi:peptide MFS transporter [Paraglaciecola hydrolytica]|uniref:Amino acid transporter n=1 Tax=Paraglaciecola hydrolytica TaxID=1799789 RepID=A0A135ZYT4_9ALTE|nr:peptide MFS transporter [Paraglaciecola hydrolytica]KXI28143.1 amino acid transporter [Paraglaciecola hydrolytica]
MTTKTIDRTSDTRFIGHPLGLSTLAMTEMWERMSYYGMRAMLVLFMTAALQEGGMGLTVLAAGAIYGLYTGSVYFAGLPGGWIADRLIGGQNAVFFGGVIIMVGHIILAIPHDASFFIGLIFVVLGTGLLKPNIGAMVGELYTAKDSRRDAGYTLYYMGINIGSLIGYGICGYLQVNYGYHYAFGAAAVGMLIGLIQFKLTQKNIEGVSQQPVVPLTVQGQKIAWSVIGVCLAIIAIVTTLTFQGVIVIEPRALAEKVAVIFVFTFLLYFFGIFFLGKLNADEKKRMGALFLICVASSCFFAGFEQAGSSLNLFGLDYTQRMFGTFEVPAAWFQSANSIFIILLSPFFAALWINLGKRMLEPSYSVKCALGLIIMASGFIVMFFAAQYAASGMKVAPYWLVATYFLHTVGELCLSPVALSAVSKLSPKRFGGQMMGVFVLTYSMGSVIAGLLAGQFDPNQVEQMPGLYMQISLFSIAIGIVLLLLSFKTGKWEKLAEKESAA